MCALLLEPKRFFQRILKSRNIESINIRIESGKQGPYESLEAVFYMGR